MQVTVGSILEGKVAKVTNYGAFVDLEGGGSGMIRFFDKTQKSTFDFDDWANGIHLISLQYM